MLTIHDLRESVSAQKHPLSRWRLFKEKWFDADQKWLELILNMRESVLKDRQDELVWTFDPAEKTTPGPVSEEMVKTEGGTRNYTAAIAMHVGVHDTHVAISKNGRLQCVLEFERLFAVRYVGGSLNQDCTLTKGDDWCQKNDIEFRNNMERALQAIKQRCDVDDGIFPDHFDTFYTSTGNVADIVQKVFHVNSIVLHAHHWAHALGGFGASPFRSPLVISYDGSRGQEFHVYHGSGDGLRFMTMKKHKLPEFYAAAAESFDFTEAGRELGHPKDLAGTLGLPGKFMGYAGVGKPVIGLELLAHDILGESLEGTDCDAFNDLQSNRRLLARNQERWAWPRPSDVKYQRAVAASLEASWDKKLFCLVSRYLEILGRENIDGLVLVGGGALNIVANQYVYDRMSALHNLDIYVPPAPGDNGIAYGMLFTDNASMQIDHLQYIGFRLWDEDTLKEAAREWGAQRLSLLGGVEYLADLLAGGEAWLQQRKSNASRPIIAIVRGRQEYGPRALGHRSLVAIPDSETIRDRLNRLKYRSWWRPAAPMIADEAMKEAFGRKVKSPYMTMAPKVRPEVKEKFPAIAHFDGTARHQSVGKHDEPWVHALLLAVGRRIGLAALLNTSFNRKGRPIVNTVRESLAMLSEEEELDYVLIEDFLFNKKG